MIDILDVIEMRKKGYEWNGILGEKCYKGTAEPILEEMIEDPLYMEIQTAQALKVKTALEKNGGYCPCKIQHNEDTLCPCKEFRESLEDPNFYGACNCGLYLKKRSIE